MVPTLVIRYFTQLSPAFFPQGPHPTVPAAFGMFQPSGLGSTISAQKPGSLQRTMVFIGRRLDCQMFITTEVSLPSVCPLMMSGPHHRQIMLGTMCAKSPSLHTYRAESDWDWPHKRCVLKTCSPAGDTTERWLGLEGDSFIVRFSH